MPSNSALAGALLVFGLAIANEGDAATPVLTRAIATPFSAAVAAEPCGFQVNLAAFGRDDPAMAPRTFADHGHAELSFRMAEMYFRGTGVAKDEQASLRWYRRAAERGHVEAQFKLGAMQVLHGDDAGMGWLRRAASQGNAAAREVLTYARFFSDYPVADVPLPTLRLRQEATRGDAVPAGREMVNGEKCKAG